MTSEAETAASAAEYAVGDAVEVRRAGAWRPGVVDATGSDIAVRVRYQLGSLGTVVDTIAAVHVRRRSSDEEQR